MHNKHTLYNNLVLMFERVDYVNVDVIGRLKDWIKYAQETPQFGNFLSSGTLQR